MDRDIAIRFTAHDETSQLLEEMAFAFYSWRLRKEIVQMFGIPPWMLGVPVIVDSTAIVLPLEGDNEESGSMARDRWPARLGGV